MGAPSRLDSVSLADLRNTPAMSVEWIRRYRGGDLSAGRDLVLAHAPLVRCVARRYSQPHARDWDDCLQEGSIGILRACDSYTESAGAPATYFWLWIRHHINRFLVTRGQCVRIPTHHYTKAAGYDRARVSISKPRTKLFSEMPDEASSDMNLAFEDMLIDGADSPHDQTQAAEIQAAMPLVAEWFLARISRNQATVLRRRFADVPETLEAISVDLHVTRERTRQIESEALLACRRLATREVGCPPWKTETFVAWVADVLDALQATSARAA